MTTAIADRSATSSPGGRLPVATAAETEVSQGVGQSVTVRKGDVETIAYNRDKGISVTVYLGQRRG
ncbi:MAG TPA: DNA gyrase modulator, partial [Casimicrobiaceae bacterium]